MALPFEDEITISSNPFLDILMKNLKILAYNCIIKDEYEANLNETEYSFSRAEIYIACIENTISLGMFSEAGIAIPDNILNAVFSQPSEKDIIKLYKNFGNDISWIPKDVDKNKVSAVKDTYSRPNYREQLLIRLKTWFLQSYEEQNNYYRMICGLPSLNSWGIPIRDYFNIIPGYVKEKCRGDFLHELDKDIIQELNSLGVIDIIRMEYPNEKYLDYITATLDLYEVRKKADLHILWLPPDDIVDVEIKKEFESKYNERRDIVIRTIYSSAFELESQFYHATMIIYILTMTILDMLAELQIHIIKKDILDRRCVEYLFSQKGVTYYKDIPYQYQQRLCDNLHNLIKYKGSVKDILLIKSLFGFTDKDIQLYQYYLMKIRNYDESGNFILNGENKLVSKQNDIINHYIEFEDFNKNVEEYIDSSETWIKKIIFYPYDNYENKDVVFVISLDDKILKENTDYKLKKEDYYKYILLRKDIVGENIRIDYYVDESVDTVLIKNNENINLRMVKVNNYSNRHIIPLTEVLPFSYSYLNMENKLSVIVGNYHLDKTINSDKIKITYDNNNYNVVINEKTDADSKFSILLYQDANNSNIYYFLQRNGGTNTIKSKNINIRTTFYDLYEVVRKETISGINEIIINYEITNYKEMNVFAVKDETNSYYWILSNFFKNLSGIVYNDEEHKYEIQINTNPVYYVNFENNEYSIIRNKDNNIISDIRRIAVKNITTDNNTKEFFTIMSNYLITKKINKIKEKYIIKKLNDDKDITKYSITTNTDYSNLFSTKIESNTISVEKFKTGFNFNLTDNTLEIDGDLYIKNKDIYISYFDSGKYDIRYYKKEIDDITEDDNNLIILIPEPFLNYIKNNNTFYITLIHVKNTSNGDFEKTTEKFIMLENNDYEIEYLDNVTNIKINKNKIPELKDNTYYNYYKIAFNFIYTSDNIINDFNVQNISFKLPIQYKNQLEFLLKNMEKLSKNELKMTDEEYVKYEEQFNNFKENSKTICSMYIKYKKKYFIQNSDFTYNNSTIIMNDNIIIDYEKNFINNFLYVTIYYLKENTNIIKYNNINISQQSIQIKDYTNTSIDGKYASRLCVKNCILTQDNIENYQINKLTLILDSFGVPLIKDEDYTFDIYNKKLYLNIFTMKNIMYNTINITYVYNNVNKNKIIPNLMEFRFDTRNITKLNNAKTIKKNNLNLIKDSENKSEILKLNSDIVNNDKINLCYTENSGKKEIKVIENLNTLQIIFKNNVFNSSNITFEENINSRNYINQTILIKNLSNYLTKSNFSNEYLIMYFLYFYIQNSINTKKEETKLQVIKATESVNISNFIKTNNRMEKYIMDILDSTYPKDYFDNQWPYYITLEKENKNNSSENWEKLVLDYDLINGYLYIYNLNEYATENDDAITYFINIYLVYKNKDGYIYEQYFENYDENIKLEFCKIPINENLDISEYLSDQKNWIDYDSFIAADNWWIGDKYKNNYADIVKEKIYQSKFNIFRTKYYTLNQSENNNSYTRQSTFFNSMLYDNIMMEFSNDKNEVFNENDMYLTVDSISKYSNFHISHLFLYIICLSYFYNNKNLSYIQHSDNLNPIYLMGFNFNILKEEIEKELKVKYKIFIPQNESDIDENSDNVKLLKKLYTFFNNFNFIKTYDIKTNYTLFEQFIAIFNDNMAMYDMVCKELLDAEYYNEFKIWEYLYYKLMTCVYDSSYFKIENDTKLAETYEEFLKDKSEILYNNLQSIKNIYDTDTKIDIITNYIEKIEQALEYALKNNSLVNNNTDFYKTIVGIYTGNFTTLKISYMKKILEFFKSYKIFIKDINTNIVFDNNVETEENSYRIYEELIFLDQYNFSDYYGINETIEFENLSKNTEP